jgi:hypothetical protein
MEENNMSNMFNVEEIRELIDRPEVIICDWDGVIQNIDVVWMYLVEKNKEHFEDYFDMEKSYHEETNKPHVFNITKRSEYYLNRWLKKEGIDVNQDLDNLFMRLYLECEDFYELCDFTPLSDGLALLLNQNFCKKVIFLSHVPENLYEGQDPRKRKAFEKYLAKYELTNEKAELVMIPSHLKKHDWIKENCPDYTCFIDDRYDIIKGVIENTDCKYKNFLMPVFGYNTKQVQDDKDYIIKSRQEKGYIFNIIKNTFYLDKEERENGVKKND